MGYAISLFTNILDLLPQGKEKCKTPHSDALSYSSWFNKTKIVSFIEQTFTGYSSASHHYELCTFSGISIGKVHFTPAFCQCENNAFLSVRCLLVPYWTAITIRCCNFNYAPTVQLIPNGLSDSPSGSPDPPGNFHYSAYCFPVE